MCDYSDAYNVVKGWISVQVTDNAKKRNKKLTVKNNTQSRSCILKNNNIFTGNAKDLDIVMFMYNLLEYNDSYSVTRGNLWNYYRDQMYDDASENNDSGNYMINNNQTITSISFEYKTKIIGNNRKQVKIADYTQKLLSC